MIYNIAIPTVPTVTIKFTVNNAHVITIIILLILAGVAISMITGGEGLFAQANGAATKYNQAAKNESDLINELLNGSYLNTGETQDKVARIGDFVNYSVVVDGITYDKWRILQLNTNGHMEIVCYNGPEYMINSDSLYGGYSIKQLLTNQSQLYINEMYGYGARHLGFDPFEADDNYYTTDSDSLKIMDGSKKILNKSWFGGTEDMRGSGSSWINSYYAGIIDTLGNWDENYLGYMNYESEITIYEPVVAALAPVVCLNTEVKIDITSGNGSETSPWALTKYLNADGNEQGGEEETEDPEIRKDNKTINGLEIGSAENPIIPQGFKPVNEGNANWGDGTTTPPGWNDGLVIQDKDGNQFVWVPVQLEISEAIQTKLNNGTALTVEEIQNTWPRKAWEYGSSYTTSTRGTLSDSYTEPYSKGTGYANENADYIEMGTSVLKNGGFYVGRYEGGTETVRTSKADETNTLLSKAHVYPYNYVCWGKTMSDTDKPYYFGSKGAVELCREMYTGKSGYGIKSSLIYGVQWDSIIEWIAGERNISNSAEWGNYRNRAYTIKAGMEYCYYDYSTKKYVWTTADTGIEKTTSNEYLLKTGEYAETETEGSINTNGVIKNIFDLAGNCSEYTMEAVDSYCRTNRGGTYRNNGDYYPASYRGYFSPKDATNYDSLRCALYL